MLLWVKTCIFLTVFWLESGKKRSHLDQVWILNWCKSSHQSIGVSLSWQCEYFLDYNISCEYVDSFSYKLDDTRSQSFQLFVACMHLLKLTIMSIQYISNYVYNQDCCAAPPCRCRRPLRRRSPGWSPRASPPSRPSPRTRPSGSRTSPTQTRPRDARRLSKSENNSAVILGIIIFPFPKVDIHD